MKNKLFFMQRKTVAAALVLLLVGLGFLLSNKQIDDNRGADNDPTLLPTGVSVPKEFKTVAGTIICLPHKETSGPVTLECAFGLQAEDGNYGLRTEHIQDDGLPIYDTGDKIEVTGRLINIEDLEKDERLRNYDIKGVIVIDSVNVIENEI